MIYNVSLSDAKYNQTAGSPLKILPLKGLVIGCKEYMTNDGKKGKHGQIFPYINNVMGIEYWPNNIIYNAGVIFLDIDWITKECAQKIFDNFEEIAKLLPFVLGIQYSASYYINKEKAGLHIYIASFELDNMTYPEHAMFAYMLIYKAIQKLTGYDLREPQIWDDKKNDWGTIIDLHNANITQRFNLYYSDYKWNDNADAFNPKEYENIKEKCFDEYKNFIKNKHKQYKYIETSNPNYSDDYEASNIDIAEKIRIDKNLMVGEYSGSALRFRIASIANNLFGEKAKEWCDRYFYYENGLSIWQANNYGVNNLVLNWLINKHLVNNTLDNSIDYSYRGEGIEIKNYLTEQSELIKKEISEHKVITIVGDPGIGKTWFFGNLAKEMQGVVIAPYNVMRKLYKEHGLEIVDGSNRNDFDFENNGCVCVYDQFAKIKDKIEGKTIFVDESHVLFKDREFRNSLIDVFDILKKWSGKVIIISATPLWETTLLKSEKELKFWKRRSKVNLIWRNVEKLSEMKFLAEKIVMQNLNNDKYTHICVFGNRSPRMIYDNLTLFYGREIHNKVNILHRDYESIGDIERILDTEILDKKITLGTSLVFNGLNFKNELAKMLVVIEYEEGVSGWWDIIQACARVRNSKVNVYVIASKKFDDEISLDDKIADALFLNKMALDKKLINYNHNYVDNIETVKELEAFRDVECTIEAGIEHLKSIKWMDVMVAEDELELGTQQNVLKSKIDEIIKKELNGEKISEKELDIIKNGKEYYDATTNEIERLVNNYDITTKLLIELNNSEIINSENNTKTVTLRTTIHHIEYNVKACIDDIEYWNNVENILDKSYVSAIMYKKRKKDIERIKDTWMKYRKYFDNFMITTTNGYGDVSGMVRQMIEENIAKNKDKSKKRSEAGKIGKRIKVTENMPEKNLKKYDLVVGQEFESCSSMSKHTNVMPCVVTQWINKKWCQKV